MITLFLIKVKSSRCGSCLKNRVENFSLYKKLIICTTALERSIFRTYFSRRHYAANFSSIKNPQEIFFYNAWYIFRKVCAILGKSQAKYVTFIDLYISVLLTENRWGVFLSNSKDNAFERKILWRIFFLKILPYLSFLVDVWVI